MHLVFMNTLSSFSCSVSTMLAGVLNRKIRMTMTVMMNHQRRNKQQAKLSLLLKSQQRKMMMIVTMIAKMIVTMTVKKMSNLQQRKQLLFLLLLRSPWRKTALMMTTMTGASPVLSFPSCLVVPSYLSPLLYITVMMTMIVKKMSNRQQRKQLL